MAAKERQAAASSAVSKNSLFISFSFILLVGLTKIWSGWAGPRIRVPEMKQLSGLDFVVFTVRIHGSHLCEKSAINLRYTPVGNPSSKNFPKIANFLGVFTSAVFINLLPFMGLLICHRYSQKSINRHHPHIIWTNHIFKSGTTQFPVRRFFISSETLYQKRQSVPQGDLFS